MPNRRRRPLRNRLRPDGNRAGGETGQPVVACRRHGKGKPSCPPRGQTRPDRAPSVAERLLTSAVAGAAGAGARWLLDSTFHWWWPQ